METTMQQVFQKYYGRPWVWGESDCCQFVGECLQFLTGTNPAKYIRYESEEAANKLIAHHGGLEGVFTMLLGKMTDKPPRDGFVALLDKPELAGIVWRGRIVIRTPSDLMDFPLNRATRYWTPWVKQ